MCKEILEAVSETIPDRHLEIINRFCLRRTTLCGKWKTTQKFNSGKLSVWLVSRDNVAQNVADVTNGKRYLAGYH